MFWPYHTSNEKKPCADVNCRCSCRPLPAPRAQYFSPLIAEIGNEGTLLALLVTSVLRGVAAAVLVGPPQVVVIEHHHHESILRPVFEFLGIIAPLVKESRMIKNK